MKSIVLVTPHFRPETGPAAKRSTTLAEHLAGLGWKVTVVSTLPHYPQDEIFQGYDVRSPLVTNEEGIEVVRIRPWIVSRSKAPLRLLSETVFGLLAAGQIVRRPGRIILCSSPYMFLGPIGLLAARLAGRKFVWEVRDLTWQYVRATGQKGFGILIPLEVLMKLTAKFSDGLITATDGILSYFSRRPAAARAIPNGVTSAILQELQPNNMRQVAERTRPTILYAGLLGHPQDLGVLIEAASLLPECDFELVGDGAQRQTLEERARNLPNVRFRGYVPWAVLKSYYAEADVLVAHLKDDPVFAVAQPSKLWEYMSTGKPVVYAGTGEAARLLQKHETGLVVPPGNPVALAGGISSLIADKSAAREIGSRGREFVVENRNRKELFDDLAEMLDDLLKSPCAVEVAHLGADGRKSLK